MKSNPNLALRLLAVIALVAAVVIVLVVVTTSLPKSGDEADEGGAKQEKAASAGPGDKYYFVQPGDSLSTIAEKEGVDPEELELLNPDLDPQALAVGIRVRLR